MYEYITGRIETLTPASVVVEAAGVGYFLNISLQTFSQIGSRTEVKLYAHFAVREDAQVLYGFFSRQDLKMFNQLLGVTGIGPKAALGILSSLSPDDLRMAIIAEDSKAIAKAPGIGPKTAKRVILDLKDKISMDEVLPLQFAGGQTEVAVTAAASGVDGAGKEAIEALVALGYSPTEATKAVRQVTITEDMNSEAVLKASLKFLAF